jgi:uncharacterized protein YwqG
MAKTNSFFDKYKQELSKDNLSSIDDLERLVTPLVRKAAKIEVLKPATPPEGTQMESHFGGRPYFEIGEEWPKSKNGKYLDFVFQIFNNGENNIPINIKLIQFFYDWEDFPWDSGDDGWLVKIYETLNKERLLKIEKPFESETVIKYCEVSFKSVKSLPDWEGIEIFSDKASKLSCVLNEDEPWGSYQKVVECLIGEQDFQSQIGGYPHWVQGEGTPKNKKGEPMKLLLQIDSEENAGLMWGDTGLIYIFYDETSKKIEFELQCF